MIFVEEFTPVREELKCHLEVEHGAIRVFAQHRDGSEWCIFRMRQMADGSLSATVGSIYDNPVLLRRNGTCPAELYNLGYNLEHAARNWECEDETDV